MIYCQSAITDRWLLYTDLYANEKRRERGQVNGQEWSGVWVDDDDIVTAVTFNEIENRTCNRNVQRFAYVCNASESYGGAGGAMGGVCSMEVDRWYVSLANSHHPKWKGRRHYCVAALAEKASSTLITDSLTGPPMQLCVCIVCMCIVYVCVYCLCVCGIYCI